MMGPSGSGKTTLLTLMGCLRDVQAGSIRLLDTELRGAPEATLIALRRRLGPDASSTITVGTSSTSSQTRGRSRRSSTPLATRAGVP